MSYHDRRTAERDTAHTKYLTDSAVLDSSAPPHIVLRHTDGRSRVMAAADMIRLMHVFREPAEAPLEAEIERLLTEDA